MNIRFCSFKMCTSNKSVGKWYTEGCILSSEMIFKWVLRTKSLLLGTEITTPYILYRNYLTVKSGQKEKGTTEDEMVGWHHWLHGHESEKTPGVGDGQGSLACYSPWGSKELDKTQWLTTNNKWTGYVCLTQLTRNVFIHTNMLLINLVICIVWLYFHFTAFHELLFILILTNTHLIIIQKHSSPLYHKQLFGEHLCT